MEGFDFVHREGVRFRDVDALGHVNNAVFLTYMESARNAYLIGLGVAAVPFRRMILARVEVDFRSPVALGEEVQVGVRTARVGTKSFELEYEVRADGRLAAQGTSVLVGYDYERGESVELPADWRARLEPKVPA